MGLNRVRVAPGMLSAPPHSHTASEEHFFVLAGSGLAWQDEARHEVRAGMCVVHRGNEHEHTFRAGTDGLDYLVYGTNHTTELGWLPRSGAVRTAYPWFGGRDDDSWDVEACAAPLRFGRRRRAEPPLEEDLLARRGADRLHRCARVLRRRAVRALGEVEVQRVQ